MKPSGTSIPPRREANIRPWAFPPTSQTGAQTPPSFSGAPPFTGITMNPLLAALLRRFRKFEPLLAGRPEVQKEGQGWRQIGTPPAPDEMERLWQADLEELSGSGPARLRGSEGGVP